ncbi:MAG: class I SAM-dependent methyltransferase [Phycisphaerales bacterium]
MSTRIGLYEDALVYDVLHASGTRAEIGVVERLARRRGALAAEERGVFLEPACGTGRYLRALAKRGHSVIGFDREAEMVAFAQEAMEAPARASRGPHARGTRGARGTHDLFVSDMTTFARRVPAASVDVAFNLINTIRHLGSDRAMLAHFTAVARVLRPRGVYVVGLSLTDYGNEFETEDVWSGSRAGLRVQQVVQYLPASRRLRREWVHSHLTVTLGGPAGREEHRDSKYWLRGYSREEWLGLIGKSALKLLGAADAAGRRREIGVSGYALYVLGRRIGAEWG